MGQAAYIIGLSKFLPGPPIPNDQMQEYLGFIDGQNTPRSKSIVLRSNKIQNRHYAITKEGKSTHSNYELAAEVIRGLCSKGISMESVDLIACGTTTPDQLLPSHAVMVHGALQSVPAEVVSFAGSCCTGIHALKYCWMSALSGQSRYAVAVGSEKLSTWIQAKSFKEEINALKSLQQSPILAFEKEFLLWMLSDGAAGAMVSSERGESPFALKIEYIDSVSFANEIETCMYAGGEKLEDGRLLGYREYEAMDWLRHSIFALKQDTRMLDRFIIKMGTKSMAEAFSKHHISSRDIDWFLPHISSDYFRTKLFDEMNHLNIGIPMEKWFLNLSHVGNVGSASIFLALEELFHSGRLMKGQKIAMIIPESARFTYANVLLTVC
jgi:3-oxoacyl-[acyl-carrier-protein] synthase-3